jgi:hypothetical protein
MLGWTLGWEEVILVVSWVVGLAAIAGLMLFTLGLTMKKPMLWGVGIALMLLPFLALGLALVVEIGPPVRE